MRAIAPGLLLLAAGLPAADAVRVPLAAQPDPGFTSTTWCRLKDGAGAIRFATASGRLALRVAGGAVRFDTDGDGTVTDADGPPVQPAMEPSRPGAIARIAVRRGAVTATVGLRVIHLDGDSVFLAPAEVLCGAYGGSTLVLHDADVDGVFGGERDALAIDDGEPAPWARMAAIRGRLVALAMAEDHTALAATPWPGRPAPVRLDLLPLPADAPAGTRLAIEEFILVHEDGLLTLRLQAGLAAAPALPGRYLVERERLTISGSGQRDAIRLWGDGAAPIEVPANGLVVRRGLPERIEYHATCDAAGVASVSSVHLADAGGGRWRADAGEDGTLQVLAQGGGREGRPVKLEYG